MIGYEKDGKFFLEGVAYGEREIPKACGFRWNPKVKLWTASANLISAISVMENSRDTDNLIEIEEWTESMCGKFSMVPFCGLKTTPRDYQVRGASAICRLMRYGIFFDMATGKTFTSLMAVSRLHQDGVLGKVLIVCPISLFSTWTLEMGKHLGVRKDRVHVLHGTKAKREKALKAFDKAKEGRHPVFAVTSWDTLPAIEKEIIRIRPEMIIGDESSFIKSRNAKRTKAAIAVADKADYVVALTGTPYVSNVTDLWSQLRFISGTYAGDSYWKFANRYVQFDNSPWKKPIGVKSERKEELRRLISVTSMTVKKEDVITLPEKMHQTRVVYPEGAQKKAIADLVKDFYVTVKAAKKNKGKKDFQLQVSNALVKALRIQQISCGWTKSEDGDIIYFDSNPKASAFSEILEESRGHGIVVFSRFVEDLLVLQKSTKAAGIPSVTYHGRLSTDQAEKNYQAFRSGDASVFFCQVQKGGFGIDLTRGDTCVYQNNWWSVGVRRQSEDRLHRPGQKNSVLYIDLVMDGGIDHEILRAMENNMSLSMYLFGVEVEK